MAKKTYKSVTGAMITFPVTVSTVEHWIELNPQYSTAVTDVQTAIEAHPYFTSGAIALTGKYQAQVIPPLTGGGITDATIKTAGTGYVVGDIATFASEAEGAEEAVVKVTEIGASGAVAGIKVVENGTKISKGDLSQVKTTSTAGASLAIKVNAVAQEAETSVFNNKVYVDVKNINQAVAVLRNEPYKVNHQALRTPDAIIAKAQEKGVSFPNLVI